MNLKNLFKSIFGLLLACHVMTGFADPEITAEHALPEIACRYQMKVTTNDKSRSPITTSWYFWRKTGMVQTLEDEGEFGEIWEQTSTGHIHYRKLYPADKTAVEFMPADNPVSQMDFNWNKLSGMLSKEELDELKVVKKLKFMGKAAELRKGKSNDQTIAVNWLIEENLPVSIIKKSKLGKTELRLIEMLPIATAHRKLIDRNEIANYRHIDAADFGDLENDPFVKKLMLANGHHH